MKRTMKLISILLLVVILLANMSTVCLADEKKDSGGSQLDASSITATYDIETDDVKTTAGKVLGLIRTISVIAGVLLIAVLGLKYMLGSVEEKADYKKSFVPLIVGAIVVMGATQIATMIFSIGK